MDEDTAYIEAVGSVRAMASLQYLGLPLPQDNFGGTLYYQTDHDDVGRAAATQGLPIDRLCHMNPLSIEPFLRYKLSIRRDPLECAVNNQHMNGRIAGDSRGARAICDLAGQATPMTKSGPLQDVRFRKDRNQDKEEQILVRLVEGELQISSRPNRSSDETVGPFFERDWPAWLTGAVFDLDREKNA